MADLKARIAKRCAKEFKDGEFANLGIGLPTMVADYIPEDIMVTFHSENGFAGIDAIADGSNLDVDIINSGGTYVTVVDRVKYFDTAESFGLVRGGHVRATVLGAMEVAENGEITGFKMRVENSKYTTVKALQSIGFQTIASGDSHNDLGMIQASKAGFLFKSTEQIKKDHPELPAYETYDELMAAIRSAL